ncbi:MAG: photosystem I reaction center subunit XII [Merismopedia sp. SIO2A8]|nr:photosystem I reaction center subunit XII [Merismopedia sp. SIO2A8]
MALWLTETDPVELHPNASEDDLQEVIRAVYRQVLGNQYVMENERLSSAESMLRDGNITVRGFVRAVAKSELYRSLFFEGSSAYRFIELNLKHFLGRAPLDQSEISAHVQTYNGQGYDAEIDSYLDSDEYVTNFGENVVPYARGAKSQAGFKNSTFTRTFALNGGSASKDSGKSAQLISAVAGNLATKLSAPAKGSGTYDNTGKRFRIVASTNTATARLNHVSGVEYVVNYRQMSAKIQGIMKSGGKVVSVTEVA